MNIEKEVKQIRMIGAAIAILAAILMIGTINRIANETPETVQVQYVIDGDTFVTRSGEKVRLIGVDTPEMDGNHKGDAKKARQFLKSKIGGKTVELEYGREKYGPYDRLLAHVHFKGDHINDLILRRGLGKVMTIKPNTAFENAFEESEAIARRKGLGVWGRE